MPGMEKVDEAGMIDRETVKKRLRDLRRYIEDREWSDNREDRQAVTDAIELLKEQEALLSQRKSLMSIFPLEIIGERWGGFVANVGKLLWKTEIIAVTADRR